MSWGWETVFEAFDRSIAMAVVRVGGLRWLKPAAIVWVRGGRAGGVEGAEAMLGVRQGEGGSEVREQERLQHRHCWTEEGNGSVGGAGGKWFDRIGNEYYDGGFKNDRDGSIGEGDVESAGEERYAM